MKQVLGSMDVNTQLARLLAFVLSLTNVWKCITGENSLTNESKYIEATFELIFNLTGQVFPVTSSIPTRLHTSINPTNS